MRLIRDGELRTATSTFTQFLSSPLLLLLSWCFTSTETIRLIRDGRMEVGEEGGRSLHSSSVLFFFFHGALRPQKPYGLLGTGEWSGGRGRKEFTQVLSSLLLLLLSWCFTSTETTRLIRDGRMEVWEEGGEFTQVPEFCPRRQ